MKFQHITNTSIPCKNPDLAAGDKRICNENFYVAAGEVPEAPVLPALRAGPALLQEQEERRGQLRV